MTDTMTTQLIEKEMIPSLRFPTSAIERTADERKILMSKLRRSMILGNIHRTKMRIRFQDDQGIKEVRTTIWAVGDKNIVLKKGVIIPINRLIDVV